MFNKDDAQLINCLPLSFKEVDDRLVWVNSPKGVFTIKSAYFVKLVINRQTRGRTSKYSNDGM